MLFVVHLTDTFKERFVKRNLILQRRQHRLHFLLYLSYLRCLVGLRQSEEHTAHTVKQPSTLLKGEDRILERSRIL